MRIGVILYQHTSQKFVSNLCIVFLTFITTVQSQLSDLKRTKEWSGNQKYQIVWRTNEKYEGK
jgi:hypothetical protein